MAFGIASALGDALHVAEKHWGYLLDFVLYVLVCFCSFVVAWFV